MFYCAVIYCTVSTAQCPEWVNDIHKGNSNPNSAGRQNETLLLLQPLLSTFSSLKNLVFFFFLVVSRAAAQNLFERLFRLEDAARKCIPVLVSKHQTFNL